MLDQEGRTAGFNARFSSLLGGPPGESGETGGFSIVDPHDREVARSLLRGLAGEGSVALRVSLLRGDGEQVRVLGLWSLLPPSPPSPPRYLGLFIEMPSRGLPAPAGVEPPAPTPPVRTPPDGNPLNGQVCRTTGPDPARAEPDRRGQVIHTILFHDAKNRLAALHGYASLLRESLAGSGFITHLDRLEEIASDIERDLGVASMFSHLGLIAPQWQNLREIIGRSASRDAGGRISLEGVPPSLWCLADPFFPRVFLNLFENARRHGERVTRIRIAAQERDASLVVTVEDDGVGVPADQKERIFELGFGRHTGYGLYLAREILSIAGLSIRETGEPGKGARFEIHIPRDKYLVRPPCPEEPDSVRVPAS